MGKPLRTTRTDEPPPLHVWTGEPADEPAVVLVTESAALLAVIAQARRVAPSKAAVLVEGESGTGKELIAHLIHQVSRRAAAPFVRVNCAAFSEGLIESELF